MKSAAFTTRVAICFILSLIPVTELENRIYSERFMVRGHTGRIPAVQIVQADPEVFTRPQALSSLKASLQARKPKLILVDIPPTTPGVERGLLLDSDGEIRRSVLRPKDAAPSLIHEAAMKLKTAQGPLRQAQAPHWINYTGPAGNVPTCSLSAETPCPDLKGKIVILADEDQSKVLYRTPVGEMSHAEILANDVYTVLEGHTLYYATWIERIILVLAMVLIAAFYILYYPIGIGAVATTGTGILILVIVFQFLFQILDIYIPSANATIALLTTYLVFTGYRLALQENLQWRSLKQAQYLREVNQMKTNFLSLMSHDLKTPLAKIQAVVERSRREMQLPPEERSDWKELLDSIENSNNELKHYITSILNLSRIESQKVILKPKSNDINQLIQQTLKRLQPLAHQKGIWIEEALEPLFSIECDGELMRQVLTNLIDNAIKYSPQGSKVIVRSREEDGFVRVDVEDFGPGIPKDQLPLMFRKFSRFLRPIKEQVKGTGLGLYLSKYFIELHGGSIRLRSIEGKGTTFTFTLPLNSPLSDLVEATT